MRLPLLALAACLLLAWALWDDPAEVETPATGPEEGAPAAPPPLLSARGVAPATQGPGSAPAPRRRPPRRREAPDPVERGTSTLTVKLVDARDGARVPSRIHLWRLDEPGNEDWLAGDRELARVLARDGSHVFENLAEGRYRVHALEVRLRGEDPPAFEVAGAHTEVTLRLDTPRRFAIRLQVVDEAGRALEEGWACFDGAQRTGASYGARWPKPRLSLWTAARARTTRAAIGGFEGRLGRRPAEVGVPLTAGVGGFEIAREPAAARAGAWTTKWIFGYGPHGRVALVAPAPRDGPCVYVAPALSWEALRGAVFLPDGTLAAQAGAEFEVHAEAVRVPPDGPVPDVTALPLDVVVRLEGHRRLLTTYRQRDPLPRWVLEKR